MAKRALCFCCCRGSKADYRLSVLSILVDTHPQETRGRAASPDSGRTVPALHRFLVLQASTVMCGGNDATRRIQGKSRSDILTEDPISQCMLLWVGTTVAADMTFDVCMQPERNERRRPRCARVCPEG